MPGGGPREGRTRLSVNVAESRFGWLDRDAMRCALRLGLKVTISHVVRAAIEHFARLSEDERTALVARYGGDGELEAGAAPPDQRS